MPSSPYSCPVPALRAAVPSSDWHADLVIPSAVPPLALPVGLDVTRDCLIPTAFLVLIFLLSAFLRQFGFPSAPECNKQHIPCHVLC